MKKFKDSKVYNIARQMPPLYHKLPGEDYDVSKSRVIWWLTRHPEVLEYLWGKIRASGAVVYNTDTGKWQGADFKNGES